MYSKVRIQQIESFVEKEIGENEVQVTDYLKHYEYGMSDDQ